MVAAQYSQQYSPVLPFGQPFKREDKSQGRHDQVQTVTLTTINCAFSCFCVRGGKRPRLLGASWNWLKGKKLFELACSVCSSGLNPWGPQQQTRPFVTCCQILYFWVKNWVKKKVKRHLTGFDVFILEVSWVLSRPSLMQLLKDSSGKVMFNGKKRSDSDIIAPVSMTGTRWEFFSSGFQESDTVASTIVFPLACPPSAFNMRNDGQEVTERHRRQQKRAR